MRAFIVLCLVAVAHADVSSLTGYNYQSGGLGGGLDSGLGGEIDGLSSGLGGGFTSGLGGGASGGYGGDYSSGLGGGFTSGLGGGASGGYGGDYSSGLSDGAYIDLGGGVSSGLVAGPVGGDAGYDKQFFSYAANEGDFDQPQNSDEIANSLKKNLQVVFIKGPENQALENAALSLAKHASDQRTAVYVLNKLTDIGELANRLNAENNHRQSRPEVHFVKYRTPEDARNAQAKIQNQYDSLGGPSQSYNGGVAPVLNFASKGPVAASYGHGDYSGSAPSSSYVSPAASYVSPVAAPSNSYIPPAAPSNSYIPPSVFRTLRV